MKPRPPQNPNPTQNSDRPHTTTAGLEAWVGHISQHLATGQQRLSVALLQGGCVVQDLAVPADTGCTTMNQPAVLSEVSTT